MNTPILLHTRLANGQLLSRKNMKRIVARATAPTDRWGNWLDKSGKSPCDSLRHEPPYLRVWRCQWTKKHGFEFREVNSGQGICGGHKTIRALVTRTLALGIPVTVEDEECDYKTWED